MRKTIFLKGIVKVLLAGRKRKISGEISFPGDFSFCQRHHEGTARSPLLDPLDFLLTGNFARIHVRNAGLSGSWIRLLHLCG